jgi:hypothetical protein
MPLIIPANSITGGYEVDNSLRFNDGSSDYLNRTPGSASNRKTWTFSAWIKRSTISTAQRIFSQGDHTSGDPMTFLAFKSDDTLQFNRYVSGATELVTNRKFRDVSAWYHIVFRCDTTNGTAGDRFRLYINGVEETSFATDNNPSLNADTEVNNTQKLELGSVGATTQNFDGYMAEVVLIDGTALDPTSFGEFDEDTGIWKPIDVSGLTFGTNGFYLDFEDSAALGDDVSGNGNDFTVNNLTAIDQTTDTPTNNFATLNPLLGIGIGSYSEGNLKIGGVSGNWSTAFSTIAVTQGKWYVEGKSLSTSMMAGVISTDQAHNVINDFQGKQSRGWGYESTGRLWNNASDTVSWGSTYTTNDIIGVALDLDNNRLFFSKNGVFQNSGDPTSSTGAISIPSGYEWYIAYSPVDSTAQQWELNFGNPPFTISSGNSDGAGFGQFEYAPPSGYLSLCTKNLATDG